MVFDTRGRRKHVIRVVYAVLALLMGASLFLVVGPFNLGELVGNQGAGNAAGVLDEQAERIETRLAKDPKDAALLLALTRARISAGNARRETDPATGAAVVTPDARDDYEASLEAWNRYLKQAGDEPNPTAAQLLAGTFFSLAESSSATLGEIESNIATAVAAQRIAAEERPSVSSLSSLAIYEFFNGDFAAGDRATKRAAATLPSKAEAENVEKQLAAYRKRAKRFVTQSERIAKAQQQAGTESRQNPFGGIGSGNPGGTLGQ